MTFSAIALFCEDIRQDKNSTDILIGVFPDNLEVPSGPPGAFPKLGIYTRIVLPIETPAKPISVALKFPDGTERVLANFEKAFIEQSYNDAKAMGAPIAGFISRVVASPFPIVQPGRLVVVVRMQDTELIAGNLNIVMREPDAMVATEPSLPSEQSVPAAPATSSPP